MHVRTFAVVVGAQDDGDVLEERDEGERPEDEGEGAVDLLVALRVRDVLGEGALVHVQRRDAEVAVHHAEALVRQQQRRPPRLPLQSKQPPDAPRLRQLGSELCLSSKH